ncbi:MAG: hypothetical protein R3A52_10820 [Polyangiales bacterium]
MTAAMETTLGAIARGARELITARSIALAPRTMVGSTGAARAVHALTAPTAEARRGTREGAAGARVPRARPAPR